MEHSSFGIGIRDWERVISGLRWDRDPECRPLVMTNRTYFEVSQIILKIGGAVSLANNNMVCLAGGDEDAFEANKEAIPILL